MTNIPYKLRRMFMKYLIAIDSDGTLRHSDGTISKRTKDIVKKIIDKGNIVTVCTARPRYHTLKVSSELDANDYLISSNGTEIYDNINKKIIWASYINSIDCEKLYNYAISNNIRIMFVLENTEYVTQFTRNDDQILLTDNNIKDVLNGKVKQIMVIGKEKEKIRIFQDKVINEYHMNVLDSSNDLKEEIWFSIVSNESSKGTALIKLSEYLKIPIENTIVFGNDNNDISMFEVASKSVAVANASPNAINKAKEITESNDNDGVAIYLEKYFNL